MLLVGLGNPGASYDGTRHNVGFAIIDAIAEQYGCDSFQKKHKGLFGSCEIVGQKVHLLKPETYMNNSGQSVAAAAKFFKIPQQDVIVFHDDMDLELGKVRVKQAGGHAGHNGLKSIDSHLGKNYWRVRIGISHPGDVGKVHSHVLKPFTKKEKEEITLLINDLSSNINLLLESKKDELMTKVALLRQQREEPEDGI